MKILEYSLHPEQELLNIMKNTTLRGDKNIKPFAQSDIYISEITAKDVLPTQYFVLWDQVYNIRVLNDYFMSQNIDIAKLRGFLEYKTLDADYSLTPPIVEIIDNQPLLIDGQHRATFFGKNNIPFNAIIINNVPQQYYPYQLPNTNGWKDVQYFDSALPEGFFRQKLRYQNKDAKHFMFREYPLPGIIKIVRAHTGKAY
ncbi:MAG: hypothetical protein IJV03_01780 [Alphaproteobacteria bacterium]|nr:hypothetical protein [Alphaproteobacteria bacterium]